MEQFKDWFDLMMRDYPYFIMALMFLVVMSAFLGLMFVAGKVQKKISTYLHDRQEERELAMARRNEQERINQLPRLRTEFLLRAPEEPNPNNARTYGSRYDHLVIYDEYGQKWFGLKTPEIMEDLLAGDFILEDYWVLFCGPGEMYASELVEIEGLCIDRYPTILHKKSVTDPLWQQWLKISRNSAANYANKRSWRNVSDNFWEVQRILEKRRKYLGPIIPQS